MPGLLDDLDGILGSADLGTQVQGQVGGLSGIQAAIRSLTQGPAQLGELQTLLANPPTAPGLGGLTQIGGQLGGIGDLVPTDLTAPLAPILGPIQGLVDGDLGVGGIPSITAALSVIQEAIGLATGRIFSGADGLPLDAMVWGVQGMPSPQTPEITVVRTRVSEASAQLAKIGERIDADRVLELLRHASRGWTQPGVKWPSVPVIGASIEALSTVETWQDMTGAQLTASLGSTIRNVALLIETPRTRVALPVIEAAQTAAQGGTVLSDARAQLTPVLAVVRRRVTDSLSRPTNRELELLDRQVARIEAFAGSLGERSPLRRADDLPCDVQRQLLRVLRTLHPLQDIGPLSATIQAKLAEIPAPVEQPLGELVSAIEELDISAITGPLGTVKDAVEDAVQAVEDAKDDVRQALEDLLRPVDEALATAIEAIGLQDIIDALDALPQDIETFVDDEIQPRVQVVRDAVGDTVEVVSQAAEDFNPQALLQPIEDALRSVAQKLSDPEIQATFQQVQDTLDEAIRAVENLDLAPAADETIIRIEDIEARLAEIDPADIPDAAKPLLAAAVAVVRDIEFSVEVATPLVRVVEGAILEGPMVVLDGLDAGMQQVRARIETVRPSVVIGGALEAPFQSLLDTLDAFAPSQLLQLIDDALASLADAVHLGDVGGLLDPLVELHGQLMESLAGLRPSRLLQPVEQAIEAAVARVFEVTGLDDVFDGLNDIIDQIQAWVDVMDAARVVLVDFADMLAEPGDAEVALEALVSGAVAKLGEVELAGLSASFELAAGAVARIERDALAAEISVALQAAGTQIPIVLGSADLSWLSEAAGSFPLQALEQQRQIPARRRLVRIVERMRRVAADLTAARALWATRAPALLDRASSIQQDLVPYFRVLSSDGGTVLDDFRVPPASTAELELAVGEALAEGLREPLTLVLATFRALAPHVREVARGLAAVAAALHGKLDAITGDEGLSGIVDGIEAVVDLLRDIDLTPITDPLDAIWGRIEGALEGLSPAQLQEALEAAAEAIEGLLSVATLIDAEDIEALDAAYQLVVDKLRELSPTAIISNTLDPLYDSLLELILPILDLPATLRALLEAAGRNVGDEVLEELARVEIAFDRMLLAIPVGGGGASGQASISASASV